MKKQKVQSKVEVSELEAKLSHKIAKLERRLELTVLSTNEMQAKNRLVKIKIDDSRREKYHYHSIIDGISHEIEEYSKRAKATSKVIQISAQEGERQSALIRNIRSKSASNKVRFTGRFTELHEQILEDRQAKQITTKQLEDGMKLLIKQSIEPFEHGMILNRLNTHWRSKVKAEKHSLDTYMRKLRTYEQGFAQIKSATGTATIEDFVTTLLKSAEQQGNVKSYLNNLEAQIEMLEDKNTQTLRTIERHKANKENDSTKVHGELQKIRSCIGHYSQYLVEAQLHQSTLDRALQACVKSIKGVIQQFKASEFELRIAVAERITEFTELNSGNFTGFLGQIEEYLTTLKTFIGYANGLPSPELRALDLAAVPTYTTDSTSMSLIKRHFMQLNPSQLLDSFETEDSKLYHPFRRRELVSRAKSRVDGLIQAKGRVSSKSPNVGSNRSFAL
jgi:hypothetical protein